MEKEKIVYKKGETIAACQNSELALTDGVKKPVYQYSIFVQMANRNMQLHSIPEPGKYTLRGQAKSSGFTLDVADLIRV